MNKKTFNISGMALLALAVAYNSNGPDAELDKNGRPYRVLVHEGTAFTVPEEVYHEWKAGKIHTFVMLHSTRKLPDPLDATKEIDAPSIEFQTAISFAQYKAQREFEVQDSLLEKMLLADIAAKTAAIDTSKLPA